MSLQIIRYASDIRGTTPKLLGGSEQTKGPDRRTGRL